MWNGHRKKRSKVSHDLAAGALAGLLVAWVAALIEGIMLGLSGSERGGIQWMYAAVLYGWFGLIIGLIWVSGLTFVKVLFHRAGHQRGTYLFAGPVLLTVAVVGLFWLNTWSRFPGARTLPGIVYNVATLLAAAAAGVALAKLSRSFLGAMRSVSPLAAIARGMVPVIFLVIASISLVQLLPFLNDSGSHGSPAKGPPVILILADTLRRDHLQCYGYPESTSPQIDRLAREAVQFINSNTGGCRTVPSTTTLFTGTYPTTHGVMRQENIISESMVTLAEHFRMSGYRTAAFISNPYLRPATGFARGFDEYCPPIWPDIVSGRKTSLELMARFLTDYDRTPEVTKVVPKALHWLSESYGRPPFLYLHLMEPHSPYQPPRSYANQFLTPDGDRLVHNPPRIRDYLGGAEWLAWNDVESPPRISQRDREVMKALYDGEIRFLDHWLGIFFEGLKSRKLYDDALIVFLTDHGEEFDDHGGWFHGRSLHNEMVGMPLIIRLPGGEGGGTISNLPIHMVDILPTLAGSARLGLVQGAQGRDWSDEIKKHLSGDGKSGFSISSFLEEPPWLYSLQIGNWKVVEKNIDNQKVQTLYQVDLDPSESRDFSNAAGDTLRKMTKLLTELKSELRRASADHAHSETEAADPETRRLLKSLGYID